MSARELQPEPPSTEQVEPLLVIANICEHLASEVAGQANDVVGSGTLIATIEAAALRKCLTMVGAMASAYAQGELPSVKQLMDELLTERISLLDLSDKQQMAACADLLSRSAPQSPSEIYSGIKVLMELLPSILAGDEVGIAVLGTQQASPIYPVIVTQNRQQ